MGYRIPQKMQRKLAGAELLSCKGNPAWRLPNGDCYWLIKHKIMKTDIQHLIVAGYVFKSEKGIARGCRWTLTKDDIQTLREMKGDAVENKIEDDCTEFWKDKRALHIGPPKAAMLFNNVY